MIPASPFDSCVDTESDAGAWERAIKRGCLTGRVSEYLPDTAPAANGSAAGGLLSGTEHGERC